MKHCNYTYTENGELKFYTRTVRSSLCLPDAERVVLLFILDRTIGWHKVWEKITPSEFANGVSRRKRGRILRVASGTGLTPDRLDAALTRLQELKAIDVEPFEGKVAYKINEDWRYVDPQGLSMWELNEDNYKYEEDTGGGE